MSNYRRRSKPKTEHIKKGFTVFQKTIATIASILGLITASITIMNAFDKDKDKKDTNPQTTIIKENQTRLLRIKEVTKILMLQLVELIIKMTTRFNLKKILKLLTTSKKIKLMELLNLIQLRQTIKQILNNKASLQFRKEAIFLLL